MTRYEQAVDGIGDGISMGATVVRVADGNDTWLCQRGAWDAMVALMDGGEGPAGSSEPIVGDDHGMEAYSELCARVARGGTIVSLSGASQGTDAERSALVAAAVREGVLDEELAGRMGWVRPATTRPATTRLVGMAAIEAAERMGLQLAKYQDPVEGARDGLTVAEAREVAVVDASLIYMDVDAADALSDQMQESGEYELAVRGGYAHSAAGMGGTPRTTVESVTQEQIESLMREAGEAGDSGQVELCERALLALYDPRRGSRAAPSDQFAPALEACVRAIRAAEAMVDDDDPAGMAEYGAATERE